MSIVPQESCFLKKKKEKEVTGHGAYTELNKTCSDKNKGMIKKRKKKKHQGGQDTENPAFVAPIQVKNKLTKDKLLKEL